MDEAQTEEARWLLHIRGNGTPGDLKIFFEFLEQRNLDYARIDPNMVSVLRNVESKGRRQ